MTDGTWSLERAIEQAECRQQSVVNESRAGRKALAEFAQLMQKHNVPPTPLLKTNPQTNRYEIAYRGWIVDRYARDRQGDICRQFYVHPAGVIRAGFGPLPKSNFVEIWGKRWPLPADAKQLVHPLQPDSYAYISSAVHGELESHDWAFRPYAPGNPGQSELVENAREYLEWARRRR